MQKTDPRRGLLKISFADQTMGSQVAVNRVIEDGHGNSFSWTAGLLQIHKIVEECRPFYGLDQDLSHSVLAINMIAPRLDDGLATRSVGTQSFAVLHTEAFNVSYSSTCDNLTVTFYTDLFSFKSTTQFHNDHDEVTTDLPFKELELLGNRPQNNIKR